MNASGNAFDMRPEPLSSKPFLALRKVFHVITSAVFPLYYWYLPFTESAAQGRAFILIVLFAAAACLLASEAARLFVPVFNRCLMARFRLLIRPSEEKRVTGATYVCLSFLLITYFFSREIAIAAMLFLTLGDTAAEIIGKNWGRVRYRGRSLEGMAGFLAVAFPAAWLVLGDWRTALAGAAVGAAVEFFSFRVDDNLTVPVLSAVALWILNILIGSS